MADSAARPQYQGGFVHYPDNICKHEKWIFILYKVIILEHDDFWG